MAPKMVLPADTRRALSEHDRRWRIHLGIRAFAAFLAFIAMIIFAVTVHQSTEYYGGNDWVDGFPIGPLLISWIFNSFLILFTLYYRQGRPIHPAWALTADLFVWGPAVPAIVFSVGLGWFWWWQPVELEFRGEFFCNNAYNFWSEPCNPLIYKLGKMEIAANVFLALVLIMHFYLFVMACIQTHKWRMQKKREAAARRNIELQYHRSPEEHARNQPPPPAYTPSARSERDLEGDVSPISQDENVVKYA